MSYRYCTALCKQIWLRMHQEKKIACPGQKYLRTFHGLAATSQPEVRGLPISPPGVLSTLGAKPTRVSRCNRCCVDAREIIRSAPGLVNPLAKKKYRTSEIGANWIHFAGFNREAMTEKIKKYQRLDALASSNSKT